MSGWVPEGPSQRPLLPPMELSKGGPGWAGAGDCGKGEGSRLIHTALSCRMDSFEDRLRQLREAFNTGRTRPAEFRAAQLQGLSRFLRDNKQQLQEALAQDLRKVRGAGTVGEECVCPPIPPQVSKGGTAGTRDTAQPHPPGRGVESPWDPSSSHEPRVTVGPHPCVPHLRCSYLWKTWYVLGTGARIGSGNTQRAKSQCLQS